MRQIAIILAAGQGTRAGGELPKQFHPLPNMPVVCIAAEAFLKENRITNTVIVTIEEYEDYCRELMDQWLPEYKQRIRYVRGGETRFHSVKNALSSIKTRKGDRIAVHDAARPLVPRSLLARGWAAAGKHKCAIPVVPLVDSIRHILPDGNTEVADRAKFVAVQTPQVFDAEVLKGAYDTEYRQEFTDDASVVEAAGYKIATFRGDPRNFKITTPDDFKKAISIAVDEIL